MVSLQRKASYIFLFSSLPLLGCIEEFVPENITFEDLLVVEAAITNEFKFHEIKLSRTFQFDQEQVIESGASVRIVDEFNNEFVFTESENGLYISTQEFALEPAVQYQLQISTQNGFSYESAPSELPSHTAQITDVSYNRTINSTNVEGIEILVDSFDPSGNARYYRFEFEETQRITAGSWGPQEIIIVSDTPPFEVTNIPNTRNNRICYLTTRSNDALIQTQTNGLSEDRITQFPVKFLSKTDSIIRDRYSILVKQHVQSLEAYTYFSTLDQFTSSESVFSENQPGFLDGNIFSTNNTDEKVLGFFELNTVSTKRLFLNYEDVFPNENQLPNFANCGIGARFSPALVDPNNPNFSPLIDLLQRNEITFFAQNEDFFGNFIEDPPYEVVPRWCGDCTFWGTNVRPEFWID